MRPITIAAPLAAILLTGCGVVAPQPTNSGSLPAQNPVQPASAPASAAPTQLPVLGSRMTSRNTTPLEVALREVQVSANVMTVTFSLTNRSDVGETFVVSSFFDDGVIQTQTDGLDTVDGVAVIDTQNAKRYLPARSADHRCMCSNHLSATVVGRDQTIYLSAIYQAVPAEVTKVSVDIPHVGSFANVPVTR